MTAALDESRSFAPSESRSTIAASDRSFLVGANASADFLDQAALLVWPGTCAWPTLVSA